MSGVLRGVAPAACKEAALDVLKVRLGRKPLCGLAHRTLILNLALIYELETA